MLAGLTHQDFAKCVRQKCQVHQGPISLEMELIECRKLGPLGREESKREPFALLFRGPKAPVLSQRMYRMEFQELGTLEIFIVPVGPDGSGMQYEAIFT
jgi:hypothetical protein